MEHRQLIRGPCCKGAWLTSCADELGSLLQGAKNADGTTRVEGTDTCFWISEDKVLVYIADVSGHGASSAFVTVLLRNLTNRLQRNLRRQSSEDILHPERFLERINSFGRKSPNCLDRLED